MADTKSDLLLGTLDMLVLKTLGFEPMHGWGLAMRIEQISHGVFSVNQGSLYPALQRLRRKGWVRSDWRITENNRRARYYALTRAGHRQLVKEVEEWERVSGAVNQILSLSWQEG